MPIYEYHCEDGGRLTSQLVLKPSVATLAKVPCVWQQPDAACAVRVCLSSPEASRLAEFDASASSHPDFYKDSRNIGLWAKKRAQDMGVDLGSSFEETVEKARW